MTWRAHCMLVFVVKKRTKWWLVVRWVHLLCPRLFYEQWKRPASVVLCFPKEKEVEDTKYVACISKEKKNLHEQCSCFFFPSAKSHPRWSPKPRRKLIVNKSSTSNQETQPSPSLPASTTTSKADESERDCQEIRRLREELGNVLRLKGSLERICPSLNLV